MATRNEKLEAVRLKKCWTLVMASEHIGVSPDTYNRWELGLQAPRLSSLRLLCKAFGMSPEELGFEPLTKKKSALALAPPGKQIAMPSPAGEGSSPLLQLLVGMEVLTLEIAQQHFPVTSELQAGVEHAKRSLDDMKQSREKEEALSRRQAMALLTGVPAAVFGLAQGGNGQLLHAEEALSLSAVNIPLCWRLYFEGGLAEVKQVLPGYLSQLSVLAREPSRYQKRVASLTSQAYQLASLLALQDQDFGIAQLYAQRAFQYGELAENPNPQAAALVRRALVFFYLKRPAQRLQVYQQALRYSDEVSFLLRGRVYVGLAEAYAGVGQEQEARHFLGLANEVFPDQPEDDQNFLYTHFNRSSLFSYDGLVHLNLNRPRDAWIAFSQVDTLVPAIIVPNRVELLGHQTLASIALGDLEQSCTYLHSFASSALVLGSDLRYNEAAAAYQRMLARWGRESRVRQLADLFVNSR